MTHYQAYEMTCKHIRYEPKTDFFYDLNVSDYYGCDEVSDTYERLFEEAKDNYIYLTELAMALNLKAWMHEFISERCETLYKDLYIRTNKYAMDHLNDEERSYYLTFTNLVKY